MPDEGVKLSESLARRVVKATRTVENWIEPGTGKQYTQAQRSNAPLWFNNSGETCPPFSAVEVSDVDLKFGRIVLVGIKPTATAGKSIIFNFRESVPDQENGVYQPGPIVRARFGSGTGAVGGNYSVAASDWELAGSGYDFASLGKIDDETNDFLVQLGLPNPIRVTMTQTGGSDGTASAAATWTYTIDDLAGNELDTAHDPTAAPSVYVRPALGSITPATKGLAWVAADGTVSVYWCNEVESVAPCTTAGGISITQGEALSIGELLGGM